MFAPAVFCSVQRPSRRSVFYVALFLLLVWLNVYAQTAPAQIPEKTTLWKGFEKVSFTFQGREAWYVKPARAVAGNPWVWRAHFPTWHTEMDSILLSRGFHVAYVNTNDLFGHPQALKVWDDFYYYLSTTKQFAPKVALEGVSRGGLYVYGWAKRNPDKVSCIYAEAPVCDFNSWPGGKGKGPGSPPDWQKLLALYNFTEEQAKAYTDNPKDNLAGLAAFKVPILHVVGLQDKIVPVSENTTPLIQNYLALGGPATVIPMTRGKQALEGHHFPIENPDKLAEFIYSNSVPVTRPLPHTNFFTLYGNLNNSLFRIKNQKEATVAFLGGSITYNKGWRDKISQYLREQFPETRFTFIPAGIPSLGSLPHAFRLQRDVLAKGRIDLLFVEAAVNDKANSTSEQTQRRALEGIIRHAYMANPQTNIILMAFADEFKLADYAAGKTPAEVKVHQDMAAHYKLPFVNLAYEVFKRTQAGEFSWQYDFKDLHPSPFGQEIYTQTLKALFRPQITSLNPTTLQKVKLPPILDNSQYQNGKYVAVANARKLNGFTLNPAWLPTDKAGTREGFVNIPMLVAEKPGASFELPFKGQAVGIAITAGPDTGILKYRIDNGPERTLDPFTQWSAGLHLPWYLILGDELGKGNHTLKLWIANERNANSSGNACRIAYFLVNE